MRIWVTRTAPDNARSTRRIRAMGHEVIAVPVLDVHKVPCGAFPGSPDALLFTSGNGVRHHPFAPHLRHLPVYAVGDRTAADARAAGYANVKSADGNVSDLEAMILGQISAPATLVHFGAKQAAGNLRDSLERAGLRLHEVPVYAAQPMARTCLAEVQAVLPSIEGIVLHSPRAAITVGEIIASAGWSGTIWCISEACRSELASVMCEDRLQACRVICVPHPSEAALIRAIEDITCAGTGGQLPSHSSGAPINSRSAGPDRRRIANDNDGADGMHPDGDGPSAA